jgi:hypothetical protein
MKANTYLHFFMISTMLNDNPMIEGTSGQVEIPDFTSDVIESLLFFMYLQQFCGFGKNQQRIVESCQ